jgi:c-di-GMP-binding flagellar brake protein YcgR
MAPKKKSPPKSAKTTTTAAPTRKPAAEQRQHPRVRLGLLIQIRASSIDEFKSVHCDNISLGGMFLKTAERRPLGAEVFFQFTLKDGGTLIEGLGRIVRIADDGMGLQFISVLEPSATIIRRLVDERLAAER